MPDPFDWTDELGPEKVVYINEPSVPLRAVVAIDNVAAGPSIGGVRMAADADAREAFRLARAMTFKNAAAGLPHGGGKSVILCDPRLPESEKQERIRAFAVAIRDLVDYIPGPDMGTDERCMAWIRDEIGRAVGLPREVGGIPLDEIGATGIGLAACAEVASGFCDVRISGARVAVQGFGNVGQHAARLLVDRGALLVAAADTSGTIARSEGLDVEALLALKREGRGVTELESGEVSDTDSVLDAECDIWIPAARPDVVDAKNVDRLRAKLVLQGANIPITPQAEQILHERGVLVVPDFVANAGGVICASVEFHGGSESQARLAIDEKIRANTTAVLEAAANQGEPPRRAALALARERVLLAMSLRRWHRG